MKVIFISRIIDVLFPMYANYKTNKSLRQKLEVNDVGILSYMDNAEDISTESLKQEYQETLRIKDKLEDKAKTNVVGITITNDFADFEHLNAYGAQKLSSYIGNLVVNQYGIKSDTTGSELSRWEKSVKRTKKALKMAREYTDRREAQVVGEYEAAK